MRREKNMVLWYIWFFRIIKILSFYCSDWSIVVLNRLICFGWDFKWYRWCCASACSACFFILSCSVLFIILESFILTGWEYEQIQDFINSVKLLIGRWYDDYFHMKGLSFTLPESCHSRMCTWYACAWVVLATEWSVLLTAIICSGGQELGRDIYVMHKSSHQLRSSPCRRVESCSLSSSLKGLPL